MQLVGLDRDLNGDHRVNLLGLILDLQRVGGLGVGNLLEGHVVIAQFDVGAVDFNGAHILDWPYITLPSVIVYCSTEGSSS